MKTKPYEHQLTALDLMKGQRNFALFMEQGTGKTKVIIDDAARLLLKSSIDALVVIAPNGVHRNWIDELATHCPIPHAALAYTSGMGKLAQSNWQKLLDMRENQTLAAFLFNYEATPTKKGQDALHAILSTRRCLLVLDESSRIKTPGAKRTKTLLRLAPLAAGRRILTGTPVAQSPLDIWAQAMFLGVPNWQTSFYAFRSKYAVTKKEYNRKTNKEFTTVVGYRNMDLLKDAIKLWSYRVLKADCLDLPEKVYQKLPVGLGPKQKQAYNLLSNKLRIELENGDTITAQLALTKLLRLQQVIGGFVGTDDGEVYLVEDNKRVKSMLDYLQDVQGSVIIWARFRAELAAISEALKEEYGPESVVEYHGGVEKDDRYDAIQRFQSKEARFFVGNPHSAGIGLTLTAASTVIYYSNDFSLESRLQSEDRAHRIGQRNVVVYVDIVALNTVDEKITSALKNKLNLASELTGDELKTWL